MNSMIRHRSGTLTRNLTNTLRASILAGDPPVGEKLPSEAQLIKTYGVSRTVIREAISALREEGLVDPRQGAGVFVLPPSPSASPLLKGIEAARISSVVEGLELRAAIEVEAAYLAAKRSSPQQQDDILRCHHEVEKCITELKSTVDADFAFHIAIAEASNNRRFVELVQFLGREMIPRAAIADDDAIASQAYLKRIHDEHSRITSAVIRGDGEGAREAMREHLSGSQRRYRSHLANLS